MPMADETTLPLLLAGPVLRRVESRRLVLWLATSRALQVRLRLDTGESEREYLLQPGTPACRHLAAGGHLHYLLIDLALDAKLPVGRWVGYALAVAPLATPAAVAPQAWQVLCEGEPALCYPGRATPGFVFQPEVAAVLHGSCRKPHHPGGDGLARADALLAGILAERGAPGEAGAQGHGGGERLDAAADGLPAWPSMLVLSGDQIYADDVAGPMLRAIHALIARLALPDEGLARGGSEPWAGLEEQLPDAAALYRHPAGYYRRETLLPRHRAHLALTEILFGGVEKPVFTSDSAHNHLVTLAEVLAMYLLVWSPVPWQDLAYAMPEGLSAAHRDLYAEEARHLADFVADLPAVRRVLAHLPVAMIFDDHDITDDWNLSREWEQVAYEHPFSRRVIGNALLAYLINQGWGNRPEAFDAALLEQLNAALAAPGTSVHDACIDRLLAFGQWHYNWPTTPPLVVIDSRTHRWRAEHAARQPSGLLDWEALTELQRTLRGHPAVLLVSPAPIFGVKLIETIQRMFTWLGRPLMVDAENWMAHRGAGRAVLRIFQHPRTPRHFVVLSGDVHYSFVYDVELRGARRAGGPARRRAPDIWQICSSGLHNSFPSRLLAWLDRLNRWLYAPRSPLNWFTRRRHMRVIPRKPEGAAAGCRLLNGSGVGVVELDRDGRPWRIRQWMADGRVIGFERREEESRWD